VEWISVNDRLPESDQAVLIHYSDEYIRSRQPWYWSDLQSKTIVGRYSKELESWMDDNYEEDIVVPSHWMPLPPEPDARQPSHNVAETK
jgi:hypothetical protein